MADSADSAPATPSESGLRRFLERWYCTLACGVYFGILGFILLGVVPKFDDMFQAMDLGDLPTATAAVIACGRWTIRLWPLYVGLAVIGSALASKIPPSRHLVFEIILVVVVVVTILVSLSLLLPRIGVFERLSES